MHSVHIGETAFLKPEYLPVMIGREGKLVPRAGPRYAYLLSLDWMLPINQHVTSLSTFHCRHHETKLNSFVRYVEELVVGVKARGWLSALFRRMRWL